MRVTTQKSHTRQCQSCCLHGRLTVQHTQMTKAAGDRITGPKPPAQAQCPSQQAFSKEQKHTLGPAHRHPFNQMPF